ncbi:MAG: SMP-30/gluconolactonase/LRE family protein, partial [Bacteroidales bacterium]|nr:SMP-30/gluconolactonase/LRE family protein [Bacteroidales bacterium]
GFNIQTGQQLFHIILPGVGLPNDIVIDNNETIYVTDYWDSKLYKIENHNPSVLIDSGLANPNGMMIDTLNNRLLILSVVPNAQILAVSLSDTTITTVYTTTFNGMDGITVDSEGRMYVSEWTGDAVHRFENGFLSPPVLFSSGHLDPADIYYDKANNILAIPCFSSNSVDFIQLPPQSIENEKNSLPAKFELYQNYPNPFNPLTTIEYFIPEYSKVDLRIYNSLGQEVKTLVHSFQIAGNKSVVWNGTNNLNQSVSAGVYYYRIQVCNEIQCMKMLYLK